MKDVVFEYVSTRIDLARYLSAAGTCGELVGTVRNVCPETSAMWQESVTEHPILFKRPISCNVLVQLSGKCHERLEKIHLTIPSGDVEGLFPGQETEFQIAAAEVT